MVIRGCLRHFISVLGRGPAVCHLALQSSTPRITEVAEKYQGLSKEAWGRRLRCEEDKWLRWRGTGGDGGLGEGCVWVLAKRKGVN